MEKVVPSQTRSILEATWSQRFLAVGPAWLGISFGGFGEVVRRTRRCQAGLGVGSGSCPTGEAGACTGGARLQVQHHLSPAW